MTAHIAETESRNEAEDWGENWVERYENLIQHIDAQDEDINRLMAQRNEALNALREMMAVADRVNALLKANGFYGPSQRQTVADRAAKILSQYDGDDATARVHAARDELLKDETARAAYEAQKARIDARVTERQSEQEAT